jgi:type II secretory pathway pseudopilin PulG
MIELIVAIVLLGIISVVVVPRFLNPSDLNDAAAKDALLATIRSAQQAALGREMVTFEIENTGSSFLFTAKQQALTEPLRSMEISSDNLKLETGSATVGAGTTCASGFNDEVDDLELAFDSRGNLTSFTNAGGVPEPVNASFKGVRICVNDNVEMSICVSPAGYAYAGDCDD